MLKKILIIGLVWPEPNSTAAGSRMMQLIHLFQQSGFSITFVSNCAKKDNSFNLSSLSIPEFQIELNDPSFNEFIKALDPDIVIFDRFVTEEQFGWRVAEHCPKAMRILDTEDLHFLRKERQRLIEENQSLEKIEYCSNLAKREIASIYRCDLSLIISKYEYELLIDHFKIDASLIYYLPFLINTEDIIDHPELPGFEDRVDFITVGNFKHAPNVDSVVQLKEHIWPLIKAKLPDANLMVYGSYINQRIMDLNNKKEGFIIKGFVEDIYSALSHARVSLAPLRFGAGLKGKVVDSLMSGTPCIMTSIAAEGIYFDDEGEKQINDNPKSFADAAVHLYTDMEYWNDISKFGLQLISSRFKFSLFQDDFIIEFIKLSQKLSAHRKSNFIGQMLHHHQLQSTKYLSKWIEEKNKKI